MYPATLYSGPPSHRSQSIAKLRYNQLVTRSKRIYLDHSATTPLDPRVLEAMVPYLSDHWGNPSSLYIEAQEARKGPDGSRNTIAGCLGCKPQEIVFTSGASESDDLALRGAAYAGRRRDANHVVTTAIEHHAVLHTAERLEKDGFDVTYLGVDSEGFIDLQELEDSRLPGFAGEGGSHRVTLPTLSSSIQRGSRPNRPMQNHIAWR